MYIDTNIGHRWSSVGNNSTRRPGGVSTGVSVDTVRTGTQWKGSQSIKCRSRRQQQVQPNQSATSIRFNTGKNSVDWGSGSGLMHPTSPTSSVCSCHEGNGVVSRIYATDELGRSVGNSIDYLVDDGQPRWLSPQVVRKIQGLFERRVLHLCNRNDTSRHSDYTDVRLSTNSELSDVPSSSGLAASKYQLIAAFLVNRGIVEAWHIYSLLPVESNRSSATSSASFLSGYSGIRRRFELTQRRRRLLQRYYSGARQYVVLYVNNSCSEHYLPVGKVNADSDPDINRRHERQHSATIFLSQTQRLVGRFFTSILTRSRSSRFESSCFPSPSNERAAGTRAARQLKRRLKRNLSLPSDLRTSPSFIHEDRVETSSAKKEAMQPQKLEQTGILRRLLEHFWLFGTESRNSTKGLQERSKNNKNNLQTAKTVNSIKIDGAMSFENRTGETSSIGLIDLSSTPESSTTSEHTTILPSTKMKRYETEPNKDNQSPSRQQQSQPAVDDPVLSSDSKLQVAHVWNGVWLPKR